MTSTTPAKDSTSLTAQLAAISTGASAFYAAKLDPSEVAVINQQFAPDKVNPYPVPAVGTQAPLFTLKDHLGNTVSLAELVKSGRHTVLLYYRGAWCPYCAATLKAYNARIGDITQLNAQLYAITPTLSTLTTATVTQLGLQYPVLSDPGNETAKAYGALNQLTEDLSRISTKLSGLNWQQVYGDDTHTLPHPGMFVIEGTTGTIALGQVEMDYRKRVEPQEVIDVLTAIESRKQTSE